MIYRQLNIAPRNRAAAVALIGAALVVGGVVLTLGLSLLLGILALAAVGSVGISIYRRIVGVLRGPGGRERALDPSMEVFPGRVDAPPLRRPEND